jgi:hydrogenase nickel incorporation protein HypA/HybF
MVEISRRHARGRRVTRLEVRVGHLRQVVPESLTFALELVAQGTELEGAELHIEHVPAAGTCRDCGSTVPLPDFPLMCSACGGLDLDITEGEELQVDSIVVDEGRTNMRPASPAPKPGDLADRSVQTILEASHGH